MQDEPGGGESERDRPLDPEKLLRLAGLARAVLEEVRQMNPDEHTVAELAALHRRVLDQIRDAAPSELAKELEGIRLDLPFENGTSATGMRVAYAGLIGWLGGLFQGLQAAMALNQMKKLELAEGEAGSGVPHDVSRGGQYL